MPVSSLELDVSILEYTRMFYNCTSSNSCSHFLQQEIRWDLVVIHGQISQSTVSKLRPSSIERKNSFRFLRVFLAHRIQSSSSLSR